MENENKGKFYTLLFNLLKRLNVLQGNILLNKTSSANIYEIAKN